MKRTRVDGQLSRLEYEEQEAAGGGGGGGYETFVRERARRGFGDGMGCCIALTGLARVATHPHHDYTRCAPQSDGYGGGGGGAMSFQRATPSTLAARRLVKPRRVDRRQEYLEAVKALNTRFQVSEEGKVESQIACP
jgi:hypothetical protein